MFIVLAPGRFLRGPWAADAHDAASRAICERAFGQLMLMMLAPGSF